MRSPTSLTTDPGGATRGPIASKLPTVSCDGKSDPAVHQTRAVSQELIRLSNSPMASPVVGVAKKDSGVRITCDCRDLNSVTVGDVSLIPTIDEVLRDIVKGHVM